MATATKRCRRDRSCRENNGDVGTAARIDRHAEEAMHLVGVRVHGQHRSAPAVLQQVGDQAAVIEMRGASFLSERA